MFPGESQDISGRYFSLTCKEREKEEQERRSRRVGEGTTETKALNLARCDIPEKNNTASPYSCYEWRKTERERREVGDSEGMTIMYVLQALTHRQKKDSTRDNGLPMRALQCLCG